MDIFRAIFVFFHSIIVILRSKYDILYTLFQSIYLTCKFKIVNILSIMDLNIFWLSCYLRESTSPENISHETFLSKQSYFYNSFYNKLTYNAYIFLYNRL